MKIREQIQELPGVRVRDLSYTPRRAQSPHWHPRTSISLVVAGDFEERSGRCTKQGSTATVLFKPAGSVHANRFGPRGTRMLQVALDPGSMAPFDDLECRIERRSWFHGGPPAKFMYRLLWTLHCDRPALPLVLDEALGELVELQSGRRHGPFAEHRPRWLANVRETLEDNFSSSILVRDLAFEAGIHPVYLARVFRRHFGNSISGYVRQRRVREVCRRLAETDEPLVNVAASAGFADQPHLTRVFKLETGMTPRAFRRLTRADR